MRSSDRYPIFDNPYPLTIHESPVTCCEYFADCPAELIPALYSVGSRQKRQGYSKKVNSRRGAVRFDPCAWLAGMTHMR